MNNEMNKYEIAERLQSLLDQAEEEQEYKDIPGFEGRYAATKDGQIWSHWSKSFRKMYDNGQGYLNVNLSVDGKVKRARVHRLIAEAYIPKPDWWAPGMPLDVGHRDDNPSNNNVDNLYWCTRKENLDTNHFREAQKNKQFTKVRCVETGVVYPSIKAAGEAIGKHRYGINLCLLGKQQTCGGLHWERV